MFLEDIYTSEMDEKTSKDTVVDVIYYLFDKLKYKWDEGNT